MRVTLLSLTLLAGGQVMAADRLIDQVRQLCATLNRNVINKMQFRNLVDADAMP